MTIRVTALLKRRKDLSQEEFSKYWSETHGPIFTSLQACKVNLVRYNQFHIVPAYGEVFTKLGLTLAEFDGAAEFEVEKMEDLLAVFGDSEYQQKAIPDEINFLDRGSIVVMVGEDKTKHKRE